MNLLNIIITEINDNIFSKQRQHLIKIYFDIVVILCFLVWREKLGEILFSIIKMLIKTCFSK